MAGYKTAAKNREKLVDSLDRDLSRLILRSQKLLLESLLHELSQISTSGNNLINSSDNISISNRVVDVVFQTWVATQGVEIARFIGNKIFDISRVNNRYYSTILNATNVSTVGDKVLNLALAKYGVNLDGSINPTGYIFDAISDPSISRRIKSVIAGDISSESKLPKLQNDLKTLFGRVSAGLLETKLSESFPGGMLQVDRTIHNDYSVDLQLNFAIYQGGKIKTTRDFCIERNNKVFHRSEILKFGTPKDKFGGYTNKSKGLFQGKPKIYTPLEDLGGYNCRHFLSWISDELAYLLRPELEAEFGS